VDALERVVKAIREMKDSEEIAVTIEEMEYDSDWDSDKCMEEMAEALEAELDARQDMCDPE